MNESASMHAQFTNDLRDKDSHVTSFTGVCNKIQSLKLIASNEIESNCRNWKPGSEEKFKERI